MTIQSQKLLAMRLILSVAFMLTLAGCDRIDPTSPESVAGTFDLRLVNVDIGRGNLDIRIKLDGGSEPSGFIELKPDGTYTLTASYGGLAGTSWQTQGEYSVESNQIQFTIPVGRTFSGSWTEGGRQISVTENLNHATVNLIFNRSR